jgi:hypothetical protein
MSTRAAWLLCGIVVFGAYGVLAIMTPSLSGPPEFQITPPTPDLSPKLAALSGVWQPADGGAVASQVVVERIDEARATVLLIRRNHSPGFPNGGWVRVRARILRDGCVRWGYPVQFTLRIAEDGATLETEQGGAVTLTALKKARAS